MQISHSLTRSFGRSTRSPKFGMIKFIRDSASFAAQTQSFLCDKFFAHSFLSFFFSFLFVWSFVFAYLFCCFLLLLYIPKYMTLI